MCCLYNPDSLLTKLNVMDHIDRVLVPDATNGARTGTLRSALASTGDSSRKTEP